jgi:hypothetical protein
MRTWCDRDIEESSTSLNNGKSNNQVDLVEGWSRTCWFQRPEQSAGFNDGRTSRVFGAALPDAQFGE